MSKDIDWTIIHAFEKGINDGFFVGNYNDTITWGREELLAAYDRGYDHGLWMYCESEESHA